MEDPEAKRADTGANGGIELTSPAIDESIVDDGTYVEEAVTMTPIIPIHTTRPRMQESEDDTAGSFEDTETAEQLLAQIDFATTTVEQAIATERNAVVLDEARYLRTQRETLANSADQKLQQLITRKNVCQSKSARYSKMLSIMQLTTITLALALTAFASIISIIEQEQNETFTGEAAIGINSTTPIVSGLIALLGTIIANKKLMDKIDTISQIINKTAYINSRIPSLIERIRNCQTLNEFEKLKAEYNGEPQQLLNSCNEQIGRILGLEETVINTEPIRYFQLRSQEGEANYIVQTENIRMQKKQRLDQLENRRYGDTPIDIKPIDTSNMDPIQFQDPTPFTDPAVTPTVIRPPVRTCWSRLCPGS